MKRRSRTRRILKWAGAVGVVLLLIAWTVTLRWAVHLGNGTSVVTLYRGSFSVYSLRSPTFMGRGGPGVWDGLVILDTDSVVPYLLPRGYWDATAISACVPIWTLLVFLAIPTSVLWWWDRRVSAGQCQACGYDLTGNVSGVCPEMG